MRQDESLHKVFESHAAQSPGAIAASCAGESLSYAALNARANAIAHALVRMGVAREARVGLCVERGLDMLAAILGILKAGAAYVPMDPDYPAERLAWLSKDAQAIVVVTTSACAGRVGKGAPQLLLDQLQSAPEDLTNPALVTAPADAAYVIYTSGSTGTPKGVVVEHRQVLRLFTATEPQFQFAPSDVWTMFHSFGFDFSVWEIWGALLYGGHVVIVPAAVAKDARAFHALLARERVTMLSQTPSAFQQLARADESTGKRVDLALRAVVFGGEALDPQLLKGWIARRGDEAPMLVNMYGITETTVHVTYRRIGRADTGVSGRSPIGVPISDLRVYLLDPAGRQVADGELGEIYVGGAGVARGYLHRPELNAERFLADPFAGGGARMYRSGDLARRLANGELEYAGRADAQVKIRGFRIEPGEVESCLRRSSRVADVAVVARDYGQGDKRLVAYVVPTPHRGGDDELKDALRKLAAEQLPAHMRPSVYVLLEALPLNHHGKLNRAALPAPAADRARASAGDGPQASSLEQRLRRIWCDALGVNSLHGNEDFFELGGTSLTAIKVLLSVREQLGVALDMSVWAEDATIAGFTRALRDANVTAQNLAAAD